MFATIGHTFGLMKMSWRVLMKDRELIFFPIMAAFTILLTVAVFGAVAASTGTFDRIDAVQADVPGAAMSTGDVLLGIGVFFLTTFIGIFFNSALVAAALERLRGGDPNVASGLRVAMRHIHMIIGWAIIAATVGLLLQLLRNMARQRFGFLGEIAVSVVGGVWAYLTFFVIPVLVAEGVGPIEAFSRSKSMFTKTWGRQFAASFGFGLVYIVAGLIALVPTAALFFVGTQVAGAEGGVVLGVTGAALFFGIALGTVAAMEGIFKAALYQYANGETPLEFDRNTLSSAYRSL